MYLLTSCSIIIRISVIYACIYSNRIEHTEIRYGGQAFRLGRYAVHFHLSGSMAGSYIRNCAIHHSNNRAVTAHGVHDLLIEGNVAYDIKGHTFFVVSSLIVFPQLLWNQFNNLSVLTFSVINISTLSVVHLLYTCTYTCSCIKMKSCVRIQLCL